ncbi:YdeI/OmpD-associated family protein [Pedobacter antarcticus]|uniref:YdhG-like domain-containing protein n=2 Tax=Pedobacter antarcticus TaxID=34086 RepID=A0A081PFF9_9SPHI|nr:YdeI/OmpD-associated family protein [Pedobacter antarcticus]KEQ29432.1 hypothetical protein N180_13455 [Pedobacter antarcticus 4BY]SDM68206.1 protein of unknown function (DU1801) [Pedobacter antarcticus]SFF39763.1 protein of unknown function (DU1801) [Pedobacter antarcticus]
MEKYDPRIDKYIDDAAEFAKPILNHLRTLVHQACPEMKETMKWSFPHFEYKGTVCSMAAFKQHCAFGFWKAALLPPATQELRSSASANAMGQLGKICSLNDLPTDDLLISSIKFAVQLNEEGVKLKKKPASPKTELLIPEDFANLLAQAIAAKNHFENFSYSQRKEYLQWITEAKTKATREKRMQTAVEWLADGKIRNWKYLEKP